MMKWINFGATLEYDINQNRALLSAQTSNFVEKKILFTNTLLKMTAETPEVRSDKRKPREDRENHRYRYR